MGRIITVYPTFLCKDANGIDIEPQYGLLYFEEQVPVFVTKFGKKWLTQLQLKFLHVPEQTQEFMNQRENQDD